MKKKRSMLEFFSCSDEPPAIQPEACSLERVQDYLTSTMLLELTKLAGERNNIETVVRILEVMVRDEKAEPLLRAAAKKLGEIMTNDNGTLIQ